MRRLTKPFVAAWLIPLLAFAAVDLTPAWGAPVLGFREDFTGPGTGGWSGGVSVFTNPGTGGVLGAGDGYLYVQTQFPANWGIRCRSCPEYSGSFSAAGISQIRLWLNDVGADEPFEIHVLIGNDHNLWQYNLGFAPPSQRWGEFVVDLSQAADFTQTIGTQSFAEAIDTVSVFLIRHDQAPFLPNPNPPDAIAGDAGIDRILLTNGIVGVEPLSARVGPAFWLAPPYPNPSRGRVTFAVEAPGEEPVTLRVIDVTGRLLRSAVLPAAGTGPRVWIWDGRDAQGRRVSPGRYRVSARGEAGGTSRPFVVVD